MIGENNDRLLSIPEAASQLRVSESTLWRWLKEGKLRGVKIGNLRRIRAQDLSMVVREDKMTYEVPPSTRDRFMEEVRVHLDKIRQRAGGNIATDAAEMIRESREERS